MEASIYRCYRSVSCQKEATSLTMQQLVIVDTKTQKHSKSVDRSPGMRSENYQILIHSLELNTLKIVIAAQD